MKNNKHRNLRVVSVLMLSILATGLAPAAEPESVPDAWHPIAAAPSDGLLGARLKAWRKERLWYMLDAEEGYLLAGFEHRPGIHPWQGEHLGKWLHAATLACDQTHDPKLLAALRTRVERLLATQEPDGYLGTYPPETRFTAMPENVRLRDVADEIEPTPKAPAPGGRAPAGWDVWTFRYNLYGLLTYDRFHPDPRVVAACRKMADLLIKVYGRGKYDLTKYGSRHGMSSTVLLESILMLYQRTGEAKYLDFAKQIVERSEAKPGLRLMGNMLEKGSVVESGSGKAYQLMANLLGYLLLHQYTGDERYLRTVLNGWEDIRANHLDVAGGPWGRKMPYNGNRECFAFPRDYDPAVALVETCSTTTWIQLNLQLLEFTGEARFAVEAERSLFNALLAAQHPNGLDWCYFTGTNQERRPFEARITCCASSGPRALEMFAARLAGEVDGAVSFACLAPCGVTLPMSLGGGRLRVSGQHPVEPRARIHVEDAGTGPFAIEFRDPAGSRLKSVRVNGEEFVPAGGKRGFHRLERNWKAGDKIVIEFDYLVTGHLVKAKDDFAWVAFTHGPWALAQTTEPGAPLAEPLLGEQARPDRWASWIEPAPSSAPATAGFRIRGTNIRLGPFYAAGSATQGCRACFRVGKEE